MAPLLYSIIRFLKPLAVLEVGAGFTTPFLLQALHDNEKEMSHFTTDRAGRCQVKAFGTTLDWCVEEALKKPWGGMALLNMSSPSQSL